MDPEHDIVENQDLHNVYQDAANGYDNGYDNNTININSIKCPICRTTINKNKVKEIKGSSDECKVCLHNNIEIYFDECMHACVCKECFNKL